MATPKDEPSTRSDNGTDPKKSESEFDRFKSLTDRLLRVPKRELDEKRKAKS